MSGETVRYRERLKLQFMTAEIAGLREERAELRRQLGELQTALQQPKVCPDCQAEMVARAELQQRRHSIGRILRRWYPGDYLPEAG